MSVSIRLPIPMNTKDEGFFKALDARIAQARIPASMLPTAAQRQTGQARLDVAFAAANRGSRTVAQDQATVRLANADMVRARASR
ncbi:MAG: hypothetical protein Q8M11_19900 [Sulfuritalea sp.]|nr:hypothetical protein [Sulfuritalea sp.]MDP1981012.1 hypothetical protein [Sulfuritalea sp.]